MSLVWRRIAGGKLASSSARVTGSSSVCDTTGVSDRDVGATALADRCPVSDEVVLVELSLGADSAVAAGADPPVSASTARWIVELVDCRGVSTGVAPSTVGATRSVVALAGTVFCVSLASVNGWSTSRRTVVRLSGCASIAAWLGSFSGSVSISGLR